MPSSSSSTARSSSVKPTPPQRSNAQKPSNTFGGKRSSIPSTPSMKPPSSVSARAPAASSSSGSHAATKPIALSPADLHRLVDEAISNKVLRGQDLHSHRAASVPCGDALTLEESAPVVASVAPPSPPSVAARVFRRGSKDVHRITPVLAAPAAVASLEALSSTSNPDGSGYDVSPAAGSAAAPWVGRFSACDSASATGLVVTKGGRESDDVPGVCLVRHRDAVVLKLTQARNGLECLTSSTGEVVLQRGAQPAPRLSLDTPAGECDGERLVLTVEGRRGVLRGAFDASSVPQGPVTLEEPESGICIEGTWGEGGAGLTGLAAEKTGNGQTVYEGTYNHGERHGSGVFRLRGPSSTATAAAPGSQPELRGQWRDGDATGVFEVAPMATDGEQLDPVATVHVSSTTTTTSALGGNQDRVKPQEVAFDVTGSKFVGTVHWPSGIAAAAVQQATSQVMQQQQSAATLTASVLSSLSAPFATHWNAVATANRIHDALHRVDGIVDAQHACARSALAIAEATSVKAKMDAEARDAKAAATSAATLQRQLTALRNSIASKRKDTESAIEAANKAHAQLAVLEQALSKRQVVLADAEEGNAAGALLNSADASSSSATATTTEEAEQRLAAASKRSAAARAAAKSLKDQSAALAKKVSAAKKNVSTAEKQLQAAAAAADSAVRKLRAVRRLSDGTTEGASDGGSSSVKGQDDDTLGAAEAGVAAAQSELQRIDEANAALRKEIQELKALQLARKRDGRRRGAAGGAGVLVDLEQLEARMLATQERHTAASKDRDAAAAELTVLHNAGKGLLAEQENIEADLLRAKEALRAARRTVDERKRELAALETKGSGSGSGGALLSEDEMRAKHQRSLANFHDRTRQTEERIKRLRHSNVKLEESASVMLQQSTSQLLPFADEGSAAPLEYTPPEVAALRAELQAVQTATEQLTTDCRRLKKLKGAPACMSLNVSGCSVNELKAVQTQLRQAIADAVCATGKANETVTSLRDAQRRSASSAALHGGTSSACAPPAAAGSGGTEAATTTDWGIKTLQETLERRDTRIAELKQEAARIKQLEAKLAVASDTVHGMSASVEARQQQTMHKAKSDVAWAAARDTATRKQQQQVVGGYGGNRSMPSFHA